MYGRNNVNDPSKNAAATGGTIPFSVGAWFRLHGLDLLTMAAMGALGLGIYEACQFKAPMRTLL